MENLLMVPRGNEVLHSSLPVYKHDLGFDEVHNCVISRWEGFITKHNLINCAKESVQLLQQTHCPNLIIDHSKLHGTWADVSDWLQNIWLPGALQAGLKRYAHVAFPGSYSVMYAESLFTRLGNNLEMMIFSNVPDAQDWLNSFE